MNAVVPVETSYERLVSFTNKLDSTGWMVVDSLLIDQIGTDIRDALGYPGGVGIGLVATVFEEIFSGAKLFKQIFGTEGIYGAEDPGLIENETVIIEEDTFVRLTEFLGGTQFGVASSSPKATAMYALGKSITIICEEARVWHETVVEAQEKEGIIGLHKPHPFSLMKASESYKPYDRVLYVGDTMADRIMVRKAGEPRYLFGGVHGSVHGSDDTRKEFMSSGSDIVTLSVNDLPEILEYVRGI